jgi:hypothetical protein
MSTDGASVQCGICFLWICKPGSVCLGSSIFDTKQTWLPATTLQRATLGPIEPCRIQWVGIKDPGQDGKVPKFIPALRA